MRAEAVACDRCGERALCPAPDKLPDGWGTAQLVRAAFYCHTGTLELCPACWTLALTTIRKPVDQP